MCIYDFIARVLVGLGMLFHCVLFWFLFLYSALYVAQARSALVAELALQSLLYVIHT